MRLRNFHGTIIPSAARWEAHTCGKCPNVHLIAFDDENKPFAEVIFDRDTVNHFYTKGHEIIDEMVRLNLERQK